MTPELCPVCGRKAPTRRAIHELQMTDKREMLGPDDTPLYCSTRAERVFKGWEPTDGKHRYSPFCTLRCALRYARAAFKVSR